MMTDWARHSVWGLDFIRAMRARPLWARVLFRLAMGSSYAYREFIGLMDALDRDGFSPYFDYDLERMGYHADPLPLWWWMERIPIPLKRNE